MKLLILQETDWLKRYPGQQHHLAEMMSLRGHEVRVIDFEFSWREQNKKGFYSKRVNFGNVTKIHQDAKVTVIRPGFYKFPVIDFASILFSHKIEIDRQIKEFRPDAIIGFGVLSSFTGVRAAKANHIPFLYYWIDVLHLLIPNKYFRRIGKLVESLTLKRADRILTINDHLADLVVKMGAPRERTIVLRAGINLNQFDQNIDSIKLRDHLGITNQDVVLFFMGFLYHFAGLKEIATNLAKPENLSFKLLIVGEGDAYQELKKIREQFSLQQRIILTGKKSYQEIPEHIAAANICLLPAYVSEPIMQDIVPIKLYEYMAMGKPVISTSLPGVMREFGQGNGMVYVNKAEDVFEKVNELMLNNSITELGAKARKFAERNSWDKITSDFENILQEMIKEKSNARLRK
jgi:glycosyltransferase involved in cell wall biosynthesis